MLESPSASRTDGLLFLFIIYNKICTYAHFSLFFHSCFVVIRKRVEQDHSTVWLKTKTKKSHRIFISLFIDSWEENPENSYVKTKTISYICGSSVPVHHFVLLFSMLKGGSVCAFAVHVS